MSVDCKLLFEQCLLLSIGEYDIVEMGDCYAEDKDDWDKPYKSYDKYGTWPDGFE